jgi:nitrogen-specific signal transduction histidine kinase/CheY-like chemotaxis protein
VAVFRDLRERKQLEAAAQARDRLATVGTLAAGVGHEINNPLTFVMSNLEIIAEELSQEGPISDAQRRDLMNLVNEALEGAGRVKTVVRGLRTFARGEREERTRLDVRQVVELSITFAFSELRHKVHVVRDLGLVPDVIADESRLAQVFINLLVNAAHAMQDLPYERNMVRVRAYSKDNAVHIEFSDNGPGMSEDVRQRVFEPFFTTKPVGEGSGLGLSIAYNVVSALGGDLRCDSKLGEGSRFVVTLPAATDERGLSQTPPPGALQLPKRGRVLVVDDEPLIGNVARRLLSQNNDVTVVQSAEEALALLLGGQVYDCVLCDLMMPGTSGMEFFAHVRGVLPQAAERFVFVSGGPTTQEAARFVESLQQEVIEKPFNADVLRAKVGTTVALAELRRGKR